MYQTKENHYESKSIYAEFLVYQKKITVFVFSMALLILFAVVANAQNANVYGQLGNFDVINHSGHHSHGFEIELEGIHPESVVYAFSYQRYGSPTITSTSTGALVRWESPYSNGAFSATTIPYTAGGNFGGSCYMGGANYDNSGCEHFGVSLNATPIKAQYRWLIEDSANPGTLIGVNPPLAVVTPTYTIIPPAREGEAPELEAEIEAPEPAEAPELYGNAQWVKVFKAELNREVSLDELVSTNPIVPQDVAHIETEWELIQDEPVSNSNGNRKRKQNRGTLNFTTRAVVRRYEVYRYTGAYDAVTHEALCADLLCNAPSEGELGDFLSAQMAAANVNVPSITVAKTGNGNVSSADKLISCGSKCIAGYSEGTAVSLTASPSSGFLFTGWNGACSGGLLTCIISPTEALNVTANFAQAVNISAKVSGGKGAVNAPSVGINCGKVCSSKAANGTNAVFTAVPETGFRFVNWSGACSGTNPICTISINGNTSVQANFAK